MVVHTPYETEKNVSEVERLKQQATIGRLLYELQMIFQKENAENPNSEAVKEFKKNLDILENRYKDEIPKIVEEYQKEYPNFIREKLPKVEEQYKKLVNWTDDPNNPGASLRKTIRGLREKSYNQMEIDFKAQWEQARDEFKNCKCGREQAQKLKQQADEDFDNQKKFKDQVNDWFKECDALYQQAEQLIDQENYRKLYAYRLEFGSNLHQINNLKKDETKEDHTPAHDREWLKSVLTQALWQCCITTYEYFYWYKNWLEITEREKRTKENFETFKKTRKERFIREAQDVEPDEDGKERN